MSSRRLFDSPSRALGPLPSLAYVDSRIDRAAARRRDEALLKRLAEEDRANAYLVAGELIVMKKTAGGNDPLFTPAEARALGASGEVVFLGLNDGEGWLGIGLEPDKAAALKERDELLLTDLRSIAIQGLVAAEHLPPIAQAKALLHWHLRHRFCSACGQPTDVVDGGWRRDCPACGAFHFPRTDPVVIMLAVHEDRCLLARQSRFAPGMWSCLAGFVEPGESIEEAVRRETLEEAGIACGQVSYFGSQPWPFPMSLMIGCHAEALSSEITLDREELDDARWFERDEVAAMLARRHTDNIFTPPPFAIAHHIIRAFVEDDGHGVA